nr:helix-turn-helix domain-containing protein [Mesonia sp. K7]
MLLNANDIVKKMKTALKVTSNKQLAEKLGVKPNTISSWKQRDSVDYKLLMDTAIKYNINLDAIFTDNFYDDKNKNKLATPFISAPYIHQYTIGLISDLSVFPCVYFTKVDTPTRIFQVPSNNMEPLIHQNAFVACQYIAPEKLYENALVVFISRKKGFFINRISRIFEDHVVLENEKYNPMLNDRYLKFHLKDADETWVIDTVGYMINNSKVWEWNFD